MKQRVGFTMQEIVLSIATIAILAGIGIPVYQAFQTRNDHDLAATIVAQTMRRAQFLAEAVDGDTSWGVNVQSGSTTLFKGTNYAARDVNFDEIFDIPSTIVPSGLTEIVYGKFTGLPQTTGTIIFTSPHNETHNVTINAKGMATY